MCNHLLFKLRCPLFQEVWPQRDLDPAVSVSVSESEGGRKARLRRTSPSPAPPAWTLPVSLLTRSAGHSSGNGHPPSPFCLQTSRPGWGLCPSSVFFISSCQVSALTAFRGGAQQTQRGAPGKGLRRSSRSHLFLQSLRSALLPSGRVTKES